MNEDAQPNERSSNRKGASVPVIRSTRTTGKNRETKFHPGGYGTRYYQRPLNRPQIGSYSFRSPSKHQQQTYPSRRPYSNRKQFDQDSSSGSHSRYITSNESLPASRPYAPARKWTGQSQPLEFSVDPQCKKGAPASHRLKNSNRTYQAREILEPDVASTLHVKDRVQIGMHNKSKAHNDRHPLPENFSLTFTPTGLNTFSEVRPSDIYDEIIIVEDIDALDNSEGSLQVLSPPSIPIQSPPDATSNLAYRSELSVTMTPEPLEPSRVFKSGVFSISSTGLDSRPPSLQLTAPLVPSVVTKSGSSTHHATPLVGSSSSSRYRKSATLISDSSKEMCRQVPPDRDIVITGTSNNSVSPSIIMSEDVSTLLPLSQHDRVRRFILFDKRSIMSVSMRGSVNLVDAGLLKHQHSLKIPKPDELIDDACIMQAGDEFLAVLGHARDGEQLSWCRWRYGKDEGEVLSLPRPRKEMKKGGVSAVTNMMQPMQFATGGYDHAVHLWEVNSDLSSASSRPLEIKHTSQVQSLLSIRNTSHKLISAGADCNVHIWDLSSERVVNTLRTSNAPYHLHTLTSPFCTLLEVAHRELQFEVRDHRLVPEHPVLRFGYDTDKVHGRYIKGATSSQLFASGSRDGYLRLWDLRNVDSVATTAAPRHGQKIIQVVFKEANVIVCTDTGQTSLFSHKD